MTLVDPHEEIEVRGREKMKRMRIKCMRGKRNRRNRRKKG